MNLPPRHVYLGLALLATLLLLTWWHVDVSLAQRAQARAAATDLATCRQLAAQLQLLQDRPLAATAQALGDQELGQHIESASRQAALPAGAIVSVSPQESRRLGESPYLQTPTVLALRGVTLPQLTTFLYHLTSAPGLGVRDLRLEPPAGAADPARWDVQVAITSLVYAPLPKKRRDS